MINIIIGGGDTINAAKKYGLKNAYLSTGGGATLQYLEKGKLKF
jgi:3-phosphoglycerate kinase